MTRFKTTSLDRPVRPIPAPESAEIESRVRILLLEGLESPADGRRFTDVDGMTWWRIHPLGLMGRIGVAWWPEAELEQVLSSGDRRVLP